MITKFARLEFELFTKPSKIGQKGAFCKGLVQLFNINLTVQGSKVQEMQVYFKNLNRECLQKDKYIWNKK